MEVEQAELVKNRGGYHSQKERKFLHLQIWLSICHSATGGVNETCDRKYLSRSLAHHRHSLHSGFLRYYHCPRWLTAFAFLEHKLVIGSKSENWQEVISKSNWEKFKWLLPPLLPSKWRSVFLFSFCKECQSQTAKAAAQWQFCKQPLNEKGRGEEKLKGGLALFC